MKNIQKNIYPELEGLTLVLPGRVRRVEDDIRRERPLTPNHELAVRVGQPSEALSLQVL